MHCGCQLWKHLFVLAQGDCRVQYHTKSSILKIESIAKCMQTQSTSDRKRENVGNVTQRWVFLDSFHWQNASYMRGSGGNKVMIKEERQNKKIQVLLQISSKSLFKNHCRAAFLYIDPPFFLIFLWIHFLFQEIQGQKIAYILSWKWQIAKSPRAL